MVRGVPAGTRTNSRVSASCPLRSCSAMWEHSEALLPLCNPSPRAPSTSCFSQAARRGATRRMPLAYDHRLSIAVPDLRSQTAHVRGSILPTIEQLTGLMRCGTDARRGETIMLGGFVDGLNKINNSKDRLFRIYNEDIRRSCGN